MFEWQVSPNKKKWLLTRLISCKCLRGWNWAPQMFLCFRGPSCARRNLADAHQKGWAVRRIDAKWPVFFFWKFKGKTILHFKFLGNIWYTQQKQTHGFVFVSFQRNVGTILHGALYLHCKRKETQILATFAFPDVKKKQPNIGKWKPCNVAWLYRHDPWKEKFHFPKAGKKGNQ